MRPHRAYLIGAALGLATLALAAATQVLPVAASPHPVTSGQAMNHPPPAMNGAAMNRALKGDRLPAAAPTQAQGQKAAPPQPRLPEGCEASVSAMTRSLLAQTPARCLS